MVCNGYEAVVQNIVVNSYPKAACCWFVALQFE